MGSFLAASAVAETSMNASASSKHSLDFFMFFRLPHVFLIAFPGDNPKGFACQIAPAGMFFPYSARTKCSVIVP